MQYWDFKMKNKKGLTPDKTLLYLLIAAVVFLLLVFFVTKVYDYMASKGDTESCRLSVFAAANARIPGRTTLNLQCPRKSIVLSKDGYTVNGKEKKYRYEDYTTNIKNVFAQEMAECWYKTGEGTTNIFEEPLIGNKQVCLICSHLQLKDVPSSDIGSLSDYLKETTMPITAATDIADIDYTYYNYINRDFNQKAFSEDSFFVNILQALGIDYGTTTIHTNILLDNRGEIEPTKEYYILLLAIKKGAFELYEEDSYFIVVGPTETINSKETRFCDYTYN